MKTLREKIFFGKGIYFLLAEFLLISILIFKHYAFHELNADDGKPLFNLTLISLYMTGGIVSIKRMLDWGGLRSKLGKVLLLFAIGFFAEAIGTSIWVSQYVFLGVAIPFPGWPDLAYIFVNPPIIGGVGLFGYIIALRNQQNQLQQKLYFFFILIIVSIILFYFISTMGRGIGNNTEDTLSTLLTFYYTGGDIVELVVVVLVSGTTFNYLGERLRLPFSLSIVSILASYIADTLFAYTTSTGTYANGSITDFFYALILFLLGLGCYTLHPRLLEDKQ